MSVIATIESVAGTLIKGEPAGVVAAMAVLLLLALIIFRTNSTHAIFRRLWLWIAGKANGSDTAFNEFMEAQDNLSQFRFISGKARTTAQMHSLIRWSASHDEDICDIKACGPYFDREKPGLKPADRRPTGMQLFGISVAGSIVFLTLLLCTLLAVIPAVLVTVTATNTLLLVDMQMTKSAFRPATERISRQQCEPPSKSAAASSGFSQQDATVICGFYADQKLQRFLTENLLVQRWTFGVVAAALFVGGWFLSRRYKQGNAALAMAARLDRPRP